MKSLFIVAVIAAAVSSLAALKVFGEPTMKKHSGEEKIMKNNSLLARATFAGGCFWCTEADFDKLPGVREVISGYAGGKEEDARYEAVSRGNTGHVEAIQMLYDPQVISFESLLDYFWRHVDPTDPGGQFVDRGSQYRTVIFYHDQEQKRVAEASKSALDQSGRFDRPVVTEIVPLNAFYPAEEYHQDFYKTQPLRYKTYRRHSGRDQFIQSHWREAAHETVSGSTQNKYTKPSEQELKGRLSPIQYKVTQQNGTEPPFQNEYWENKQAGIYVDVVSGEPLFSSEEKFESGTGWPSFTRPLVPENVVEIEDRSLFTVRTEVRSRHGDSHLGHVFSDGPQPTGLRYCINSAALRFIPVENLSKEGYGEFGDHFNP